MKKKFLFAIWAVCALILLGGCSQESYQLKEEEYYLDMAKSLDIAFPELTFEHAKDLNSGTLYLMFTYFVTTQKLYNSGEDFKVGNIYQIPKNTIEEVLKEYLGVKSFDGKSLHSENLVYNESTKQVVTEIFGAFGGTRDSKLDSLEYLGGNKVKFIVSFFQEDGALRQIKEYQIKQKDDENTYTLLSILNKQ
jgi:hypothetical protein